MPRQVDHEQRRFEIATAVWQLLATRGPAAVTMRAVAAEAEISVGRIQHYFASKDAMLEHGLVALLATADSAHGLDVDSDRHGPRDALVALLTHAVPATAVARIGTAVWYAYLALGVDRPAIGVLLATALAQSHAHATSLVADLTGESGQRASQEALALLSMSDGLSQRVLVGAVDAEGAVRELTARVDALSR